MTNRYLLCLLPCIAICVCSLLSCKKESIDNDDNGYPIQLTAEQAGRNVNLTWTVAKTAEFQQYIVVRSSSPIPDDPTPSATTIASLDDYKVATMEDKTVPLTESNYYKVYVKIGDRFIFSPTVEVKNNVKLWNIQPTRVLFDKEHNRVFIFDGSRSKLYKYNYETEKLEDSLLFANSFDLRMALGNHGSGDELYLAPNTGTSPDIKIYNPDNFQLITTIPVGSFIFSIASGNNGFLYVGSDNWQRSISVYKRSTKQFVSGDSSLSGFGESNLGVLSTDGFTVIQTASSQIFRYKINPQGLIESLDFSFINSNFFSFFQHISKSSDNELFCFDANGSIVSNDLQVISTLSNIEFIFFTDLVFADDNNGIFGITNNSEFIEIKISTSQVQRRFSLAYAPLRIEQEDGKLLIVGLVFDNTGLVKTIIDKIDID